MTDSALPPTQDSSAPVLKPRRRSKIGLIILIGIGGVLLAVFLGIQLIPVNRTNPPVTSPVKWDSPQTQSLAARACMDCHSNETVWPWYSYVAPTSWLVYYDVQRGRSQLNFSTYSASSGQPRGNPFEQAANGDLAYQLGQILSGGGGAGPEGRGFPGGPPNGTPGANRQFPTRTAGQQNSGGGQNPGGQFPQGGGISRQLTDNLNNNVMPPANYLLMHATANLTSAERQQLLKGLMATLNLQAATP